MICGTNTPKNVNSIINRNNVSCRGYSSDVNGIIHRNYIVKKDWKPAEFLSKKYQ